MRDERHVRRLINRVSVEASFFKKLSALENLMYAARLYDLPAAEARERSIYIAGFGGGLVLAGNVTVVTPTSPMGRAVLGKQTDDECELVAGGTQRTLAITAVAVEETEDAESPAAQSSHDGSSGAKNRAMMPAVRCHSRASRCSCFRPALVRA